MKSPPERAASDRVWLDWDLWEPDITRGSVEFAMSCSDRSRDRYTQHASDSTRMMGPRCGILSYLRWAGKVKKMSSRVIALYFDNSRLGQIHGLETVRPRSFHTWWDVRVSVSWQCWHSFYYAIFVPFCFFSFFLFFLSCFLFFLHNGVFHSLWSHYSLSRTFVIINYRQLTWSLFLFHREIFLILRKVFLVLPFGAFKVFFPRLAIGCLGLERAV